jgi:hypothetical protein
MCNVQPVKLLEIDASSFQMKLLADGWLWLLAASYIAGISIDFGLCYQ